ncbi:MAG: hypothetical protein Q9175_002233 [Cornicularia normoerica]
MAPHALIDFHDSSGYYPSISSNAFLRATAVQECSKASITDLEKNPSSKKLLAFSRQGPCVWHLSTEENEDVEESMRYFSGLPLSAINPRTFPLTQGLRSKLRHVLQIIYGAQQFLVISGLRSSRHNDLENVIIHTGLSSHVGNRRGMAGREGGDNTVLR